METKSIEELRDLSEKLRRESAQLRERAEMLSINSAGLKRRAQELRQRFGHILFRS